MAFLGSWRREGGGWLSVLILAQPVERDFKEGTSERGEGLSTVLTAHSFIIPPREAASNALKQLVEMNHKRWGKHALFREETH